MNKETFNTIEKACNFEIKEKGSRFIAFAFPINNKVEIKKTIELLREEHHKARHWCYAYRLGIDGLEFRANDDGEPAGTAGRPILGQIDSADITDVLVVVVRYFGGVLLGVPGLIKAYKKATSEVLKHANVITKNVEKKIIINCEYNHLNDVIRIIKQNNGIIINQLLEINCRLVVKFPLSFYAKVVQILKNMKFISITLC